MSEKVLIIKGFWFHRKDPLLDDVYNLLIKNGYDISEKIYNDYKPYEFTNNLDEFLNNHKEYIAVIGNGVDASVVEALMTADVKKILINSYKTVEDKVNVTDVITKNQFHAIDNRNIHGYDDMPALRSFEPIYNLFESENEEYNLKKGHYQYVVTKNDNYKESLLKFLKITNINN